MQNIRKARLVVKIVSFELLKNLYQILNFLFAKSLIN